MKFKDALYTVLDEVIPQEGGKENKVNLDTIKTLSILWNMLAVSENVLDDLVYISKDMSIVSAPLQESSKKTVGKRGSSKKPKKSKETLEAEKEDEPVISAEGIDDADKPATEQTD